MFTLLVQKLEDICGHPIEINPSPEIDVLESYGGHLTIDEYRNINGNLTYEISKNIQSPLFFPTGDIVEEMLGVKMLKV